jgi:hypothetical protein
MSRVRIPSLAPFSPPWTPLQTITTKHQPAIDLGHLLRGLRLAQAVHQASASRLASTYPPVRTCPYLWTVKGDCLSRMERSEGARHAFATAQALDEGNSRAASVWSTAALTYATRGLWSQPGSIVPRDTLFGPARSSIPRITRNAGIGRIGMDWQKGFACRGEKE